LITPSKFDIASRGLASSDRILITGATGWLGRSAVALIQNLNMPYLLTASQDQTLIVDGKASMVRRFSIVDALDFSPTVVLDFAFITRDRLVQTGHEEFLRTNRHLIDLSKKLLGINTVRKFVAFSSGAAVPFLDSSPPEMSVDPYGFLKAEYENEMKQTHDTLENKVVITRPYSLSGRFVRNRSSYALFNIIDQASQFKSVTLSSKAPVFRRYVDAEEFIALSLNVSPGAPPLESGGDLVELGDLAELIISAIGSSARVQRGSPSGEADNYHSDGKSMSQACSSIGFQPACLRDQILASAPRIPLE
jgi:nucleoside-diphosphate-sugar epimerase